MKKSLPRLLSKIIGAILLFLFSLYAFLLGLYAIAQNVTPPEISDAGNTTWLERNWIWIMLLVVFILFVISGNKKEQADNNIKIGNTNGGT